MATDADAQAWIDDVVLDGGTVRDETAIDNLVIKLKNDGLWAKQDRIWVRKYTGSSVGALKCLKTLIDSVNFGAVFDDDNGFIGDGVDDFIETNARAQAYATFTQDSAHYAVRYKPGAGIDVDGRSGKLSCHIYRDNSGFRRYTINGGAAIFADTQGDNKLEGLSVAVREDASNIKLYNKDILIDSTVDTSAVPDGGDFGSLAYNGSTFSMNSSNAKDSIAGTEEFVSIGGALTATDVTNLEAAITAFYTEVETVGTTISGITQKDGVTLVADGTYVQHLYGDDNKGTNETLLETGQTTGGEVTFTGELPVGKVRFIRIAYQDAGRDVVKEQFFTD